MNSKRKISTNLDEIVNPTSFISLSSSTEAMSSSSASSLKSPKLMIISELRRELTKRKLNSTGDKPILVKRLEGAIKQERTTPIKSATKSMSHEQRSTNRHQQTPNNNVKRETKNTNNNNNNANDDNNNDNDDNDNDDKLLTTADEWIESRRSSGIAPLSPKTPQSTTTTTTRKRARSPPNRSVSSSSTTKKRVPIDESSSAATAPMSSNNTNDDDNNNNNNNSQINDDAVAVAAASNDNEGAKTARALLTIFGEAQNTSAHAKHIASLEKLLQQHKRSFMRAFLQALNTILATPEVGSTQLQRLLRFVVEFVSQAQIVVEREKVSLSPYVIDDLLPKLDAADRNVRTRVSQLLADIIEAFPETGAPRMDLLFSDAAEKLLQRTKDRLAPIRCSSIRGLKRLQQLPIFKVQIAEAMQNAMRDQSVDVRIAAVECVRVNDESMPFLLERLRDVDSRVRRSTLTLLATNAPLRKMHRAQRVDLLRHVLLEHDPPTRESAIEMIRDRWLAAQCGGSCVQLLRQLEVASDWRTASVCADLLRALMPIVRVDAEFDARDSLTPERALIWRIHIELFGDDPYLPELSRFAELLREYQNVPFIAIQLIHLCHHLDMGDEAGRRVLSGILRAMIPDREVSLLIVPHCVLLLRALIKSSDEYARHILECIAELREPLDFGHSPSRTSTAAPAMRLSTSSTTTASTTTTERVRRVGWLVDELDGEKDESIQQQQATAATTINNDNDLTTTATTTTTRYSENMRQLMAKVDALQRKKVQLVKEENFDRAAQVKAKVEELQRSLATMKSREDETTRRTLLAERKVAQEEQRKRDARVLTRCLIVVELLLGTLGSRRVNDAGIDGLFGSVIRPALTHQYPRIRAPAMRCLALYSLHVGLADAKSYLRILINAVMLDRYRVQRDGLKAMFDLICVYGESLFDEPMTMQQQQNANADSPQTERLTSTYVFARMLAFLESTQDELCVIAVEGFAKLIYGAKMQLDSVAAAEALMLLIAHSVRVNDETSQNLPTNENNENNENYIDVNEDGTAGIARLRLTLLDGTPAKSPNKRKRDETTNINDELNEEIENELEVDLRTEAELRESDVDIALESLTADSNVRISDRSRIRQLLDVFFENSKRVPQLASLAASNLLTILRRAHYTRDVLSPFGRIKSPLNTGQLALSLIAGSPAVLRLMAARLVLAESLANPTGAERSYVRLLKSIAIQDDDPQIELQRLLALVDLAAAEFTDKPSTAVLKDFRKSIGAFLKLPFDVPMSDSDQEKLTLQLKKHRKDHVAWTLSSKRD